MTVVAMAVVAMTVVAMAVVAMTVVATTVVAMTVIPRGLRGAHKMICTRTSHRGRATAAWSA
jgi:hypothetical protein